MNSTAFVSATPILSRASAPLRTSALTPHLRTVTPPRRGPAAFVMKDSGIPEVPKIPQGFTAFSEQLNGRAAMIGFLLAVVTEAITGRGIIGQVASIFEVVNRASALGN